jgi:hypothetical protein
MMPTGLGNRWLPGPWSIWGIAFAMFYVTWDTINVISIWSSP